MARTLNKTCPRCERELNVTYAERTPTPENSLYNVPLAPDADTPACQFCVEAIREDGISLPEPRGWEDCVVQYDVFSGWRARAVVSREDWMSPRGNLLCEYIGPAPASEQPDGVDVSSLPAREELLDGGGELVLLTYDSAEVTSARPPELSFGERV